MNSIAEIGGKLAAICGIAAIILGVVNSITEPRIEANRERALLEALQSVAGDYAIGEAETVDSGSVETVYSLDEGKAGYICLLKGTGYGGELKITAAYTPEGEILGVVLTEDSETPGLGKVAESAKYMLKYLGTGGRSAIPVSKQQLSQSDADSVTGATITFTAIGKALVAGSEYIMSLGAK